MTPSLTPITRLLCSVAVLAAVWFPALALTQDSPMEALNSAEFFSADVETIGIASLQDLTRYVPNQFATDSGSRSFGDVLSLRGLTNTRLLSSPSTTVYVDDVPFGETFTYAPTIAPIQSIDVFRGPQPLLAGRNSYSGSIQIRTPRPTDKLEGGFNYGFGTFDSHDADGWMMGPIIPGVLGFRLAGGYDATAGNLLNPITGESVDRQEHRGISGGLFFTPAPFWQIDITAGYDEFNDEASRYTSLFRTTGFYTAPASPGEQDRRASHQAIRIAYDNERYRFLSVTSHRSTELDPYVLPQGLLPSGFTDYGGASTPLIVSVSGGPYHYSASSASSFSFGAATLTQNEELWSQEFRLGGVDPDADWNWNAGVYTSSGRVRGSVNNDASFFSSTSTLTAEQRTVSIPGFGTVPALEQTNAYSSTSGFGTESIVHSMADETLATYGGVDYKGFAPVTLHAGVRLDWIQRSMVRDQRITGQGTRYDSSLSLLYPEGFPFPLWNGFDVSFTPTSFKARQKRITVDDQWFHATPSVGLDWELCDHALTYIKSSYAFKPGGFSPYTSEVALARFEEERVWASEAGLKTTWLDDRLQLNAATFYNTVEDYQVEMRSYPGYRIANADEAEIYGLEFDSRFAVLPILDLIGSIGWTHGRLTDFTDPSTGSSLHGVTPPFVPEFDAVVALDGHLENGLFARVEYLLTGETKFDVFDQTMYRQAAYGLLNGSVGWRHDQMSVALYGTNLSQEDYYTNMVSSSGIGAVGNPREYGVRLGVRF